MACPCLSDIGSNITTQVDVGGVSYSVYSPNSTYGLAYGLSCNAHDVGLPPYCDGVDRADYCARSWCYVDVAECDSMFEPTLSTFMPSANLYYSYATCNSSDTFADFYTTGYVHLCSVLSLTSADTAEIVVSSGDSTAQPCGDTNTKGQVTAMVNALNALNDGRGFRVPNPGAVMPHLRMTYTWETYPFGEWESIGRQKSLALFENGTCDVVVGMANGCFDPDIQAQARLARNVGKIYVTGRGPREVLRAAGNDGILPPWIFSTHIRSDTYAEDALVHLRQNGAQSVAIIHESLSYGNDSFYAGLGTESERIARASLGYDVRLQATVERPPGYNASSRTPFDAARLDAALEQAVASRADVLLAVMRPPEWQYTVARLRELRESSADREGPASEPHSFLSIWFQGASWGTHGDCIGLGPSVCAHVIGAEQMSRLEALDAYGDALLDGRTYRWLKASEHMTEPIESSTDKPDGAMIPSIIAQAMQHIFRRRILVNDHRPLYDPAQYQLLREFLSSGNEVARTFYGAVRFDRFGQNQGKVATTMQMDDHADTAGAANSNASSTYIRRALDLCMVRETTACGIGQCLEPYVENTSLVEGATWSGGAASCPCLTSLDAYNHSNRIRAGNAWWSAFMPNSTYGNNYGIGCSLHDVGLPPHCNRTDDTLNLAWCEQEFCWVDPHNCDQNDVDPSGYLAHATTAVGSVRYSYDTCIDAVVEGFESALSTTDLRPRARIILPSSISEVLLRYPSQASVSCAGERVRSVGNRTCLLCEAAECVAHSPPPSPPPPPSLPPPLMPPPAPAPPPPPYLLIAGCALAALGLLIMIFLSGLVRRRQRRELAEALESATERAEIMGAIESMRSLRFPAAMISAADFFVLGQLESHEAMRSAGKLFYNDTLRELADAAGSRRFYIFISRTRDRRSTLCHETPFLCRLARSGGLAILCALTPFPVRAPFPCHRPMDVVECGRPDEVSVPCDGGSHQAHCGASWMASFTRHGVGRLYQHPAAERVVAEGGGCQPRRVCLVRGGLSDRRSAGDAREHRRRVLARDLSPAHVVPRRAVLPHAAQRHRSHVARDGRGRLPLAPRRSDFLHAAKVPSRLSG